MLRPTLPLLLALCLASAALADPPRFADVSTRYGTPVMPAGRAQLIDIDGDGWLDLCVSAVPAHGAGALRLYRNVPAGSGRRFVEMTAASGINLRPGGAGGRISSYLAWGHIDGDGHLDAVSVAHLDAKRYAADKQTHRVYLGAGRGKLKALEAAGIEREGHRVTMSAVLADLDLDGHLDLVFANSYDHYGQSLKAQQMRAYHGAGDGKFAEATKRWGLLTPGEPGAADFSRPLFGLTASDLDNDGHPELLGAAYGRQWNTAWFRGADGRYTNRATALGIDGDAIRHGRYPAWMQTWWTKRYGKPRDTEQPFRSNGNTFALVSADIDGDGDLDLFSADITHAWAGEASDLSALLVNQLSGGKLGFKRQLEALKEPDPATGLRWRPTRGLARDHGPQEPKRWNQGDLQAHWADLDNDGRLDLLICESDYPHNRLRVFRQTAPLTFVESQKALGLDWPNCPGLAIGDLDRDGDLDLVTTGTRTRWREARERNALAVWENRATGDNGFLALLLVGDGETANRSAIGARVELVTDQGRQTRELQGPYGHWAAQRNPGELHFGLGSATPKTLLIRWPDKARSTTLIKALPRRGWLVIRQGQAEPEVLEAFDPARWRVELPAVKKPAEKKPAEKKPAEKKPAEKKPAEKKPAEKKPAE